MEKIKRSLFDLSNDLKSINRQIEDNNGELPEDLEKSLDVLQLSLAEKTDAYYIVSLSLESRAQFFKDLEDKAKAARKSIEASVDNLNDRIKSAMISLGQKELTGNSVRYVLSPAKEKLIIEDESSIPEEYLMTVVSKEPDKEKIRETLKVLGSVPGVKTEGGFSLRKYLNKGE